MVSDILVFLLLGVLTSGQDIYDGSRPQPVYVHPSTLESKSFTISDYSPKFQQSIGETRAVLEKDTILSVSCLVCCKMNYSVPACEDEKLCKSAKCTRFMERIGSRPKFFRQSTTTIGSSRRSPRLLQSTAPADKDELCRQKHPLISDIKYIARLDYTLGIGCSYYCASRKLFFWEVHTKEDGMKCSQNKVCWEGKCLDQGDTVDDAMCRAQMKTKPVKALVNLPCRLICQDTRDKTVWIYPKTSSPLCLEPDWMPRRENNF